VESPYFITYEVDIFTETIAEVLQELERRKDEFGVGDWVLVGQTTLDDVFCRLCDE
jgi:hypothetical protein